MSVDIDAYLQSVLQLKWAVSVFSSWNVWKRYRDQLHLDQMSSV